METPVERHQRLCEALRPEWERMARDNKRKAEIEAERLRVLWDGIEVGDVVELTEEEHVRRGGLLMVDENGEVQLEQGKVLEIKGDLARVQVVSAWGFMGEWIGRERISRVVKEGLKVQKPRRRGDRYWEAG